jgi:hypothetical protein
MGRWFKFYEDAVDDPQIQKLSPEHFKVWVNLLCLTAKYDGYLPDINDISFALRMPPEQAEKAVIALVKEGLLVVENSLLVPDDWAGRIGVSLNNAKRQKRFRDNKKAKLLKVKHEDDIDTVT